MSLYLCKQSTVLHCLTAGMLRGQQDILKALALLTVVWQPTALCTMADGAWQAGRMQDNIVSSIVFTLKGLKRDKAQNGCVQLWFVLYLPNCGCKSRQAERSLGWLTEGGGVWRITCVCLFICLTTVYMLWLQDCSFKWNELWIVKCKVKQCRCARSSRRFERSYCLHLQG